MKRKKKQETRMPIEHLPEGDLRKRAEISVNFDVLIQKAINYPSGRKKTGK